MTNIEKLENLYNSYINGKIDKLKILNGSEIMPLLKEKGKLEVIKASKLELILIYNLLYTPKELTFINRSKNELVDDIYEFLKYKARNKAIESCSTLIGR